MAMPHAAVPMHVPRKRAPPNNQPPTKAEAFSTDRLIAEGRECQRLASPFAAGAPPGVNPTSERSSTMRKYDPLKPKLDVHQAITDKIVAAIEAGAGTFEMPWHRPGISFDIPKSQSLRPGVVSVRMTFPGFTSR